MNAPYEDWMLTAYALGELDANETAIVEQAIAENDGLKNELAAIRATLGQVESALQTIAPVALTSIQTDKLRTSIADAAKSPDTVINSGSKPHVVLASKKNATGHRKLWLALTAVAASIVAALFFVPALLNQRTNLSWSKQPTDEFPAGTPNPTINGIVTEGMDGSTLEKQKSWESDAPASGNLADQFSQNSFSIHEKKDAVELSRGSTVNSHFGTTPFFNESEPRFSEDAKVISGPEPAAQLQDGRSLSSSDASKAEAGKETPSLLAMESKVGAAYGGAMDGQATDDYGATIGSGAARFGNQPLAPPSQPASSALADHLSTTTEFSSSGLQGVEERVMSEDLSDDSRGLSARFRLVPNRLDLAKDARISGDRFEAIVETPFQKVADQPVTTFSIDVDTAAYSKVRQAIMEANQLPNPNAVRIEEMLNYFDYDYQGPTDEKPFAANLAATTCPWNNDHKLVRIALQAKKIESENRPLSNLVFLLDVSGSMDEPNKLPLVKKAIGMLTRQLGENDRVAIVVYAGAAGLVLPSTRGNNQQQIMTALDDLHAGGSTNGGQGIQLAYDVAKQNYIRGGVNRILLCTDGDFNVGTTGDESLVDLVERNAKENRVFLSCFGFGMGNYNDSMMEKITNKGNGTYAMIDTELEARKLMVEQIGSTLVTVAKDVKIQVEFNPQNVGAYRLIGYENRKLANRDFNDDTKDAGEIGAGHRVTVLYEIVPAGMELPEAAPEQDALRYAAEPAAEKAAPAAAPDADKSVVPAEYSSELLNVKLRYKKPEEDVSTKIEFPLSVDAYEQPVDKDFRWAASIAQFGMLLRHSQYASNVNWPTVIEQATMSAGGSDYRLEAVDLMRRASRLSESK